MKCLRLETLQRKYVFKLIVLEAHGPNNMALVVTASSHGRNEYERERSHGELESQRLGVHQNC
jgi:hypothetical protein